MFVVLLQINISQPFYWICAMGTLRFAAATIKMYRFGVSVLRERPESGLQV